MEEQGDSQFCLAEQIQPRKHKRMPLAITNIEPYIANGGADGDGDGADGDGDWVDARVIQLRCSNDTAAIQQRFSNVSAGGPAVIRQ